MEFKKRLTAYKIGIKSIQEGKFIKTDESLNTLKTDVGTVSRVNVLGIVIAKEANDFFSGVVIDDGSGSISVKSFENRELFENLEVGDAVNVFGKVRVYAEQKYISSEIIKKVDRKWLEHRKKEFLLLEKIYKKFPEEDITVQEEEIVESGNSDVEKICKLIKSYDSAEGADINLIIKNSGIPQCEKIIGDLLKSGDIFEILPGKIKILE